MLENIDWLQVKTLVKHAIKHEFRVSSISRIAGKKKFSPWSIVFSLLLYALIGTVFINFLINNQSPEGLLAVLALLSFYVTLITSANIFLSFGSGFLSPDEAIILAPFPITSETFFTSRLLILLVYSTIVSITLSIASMVFLTITHGFWGLVSVAADTVLTGIATAMMIIILYGTLFIRIPRSSLTKLFSYTQFLGSLITSATFLLLPRVIENADLHKFTLDATPSLQWAPPFWFASLGAVILHLESPASIEVLGLLALVVTVVLSLIANKLIASGYQDSLQELSSSTSQLTKAAKKRNISYGPNPILFRTHESRATWLLFRAQIKYDTKFRLSLLSSLPITGMYLLLAILQGKLLDPFLTSPTEGLHAAALYIIALVSPFLIMQQISQTESYKASWIFFAAPVDRSKLLLSVRNIIFGVVFFPYMLLLAGVFSIYMPVGHALMHIGMIALIAVLVFQSYMLVSPKVPFSEQRKMQRNTYSIILWGFVIATIPLTLLIIAMYFGYPTVKGYLSFLALFLTLAILLEVFLRSNLSTRLERQEYAG